MSQLARMTLLVMVAAALLGAGVSVGRSSPALAATGQATFTLTNGVQSYDDTTPGGMALKALFKATSIAVQAGKANGLTNLPVSLTYGGKPLTGTAALSLRAPSKMRPGFCREPTTTNTTSSTPPPSAPSAR